MKSFRAFLGLLFLLSAGMSAFGEGELKYMAYNFYANPHTQETSGKFSSFLIDFKSDKTPLATYWALANFSLDVRSERTKKAYEGIRGMSGYAGLQNAREKVGIISFWEARYKEGTTDAILHAERIFPEGSNKFAHEGEGTNCIKPFDWSAGKWYRMLLHSWNDLENGTTFAGLWFLDVTSGEWKLFSYFDTRLYDSFFVRGISQFMENFYGGNVQSNCHVERDCFLKNMYVYDCEKKKWVSLHTATLSYGDGGGTMEHQKKFGAHKFGATEEHFFGTTGGLVKDQEAYEKMAVKSAKLTIKQPDNPSLGSPKIANFSSDEKGGVTWSFSEESTPQLAYRVRAIDQKGKVVFQKAGTRPEVRSLTLPELKKDKIKIELTIVDVFGAKTKAEYMCL